MPNQNVSSVGAHTQNHLPAVQRNPVVAASVILGLLCLLLVTGIIVLFKLCENLIFIVISYIFNVTHDLGHLFIFFMFVILTRYSSVFTVTV